MNDLQTKYQKEVLPKMKDEFGIKNPQAFPELEKIVVNVGAGESLQNKEVLEKIKEQLANIV